MASDIIERWKASVEHQLCLPLLPFTQARYESINADSLNSQLPTARKKGVAAGHSGQFTPCGYLSTLWYTLL